MMLMRRFFSFLLPPCLVPICLALLLSACADSDSPLRSLQDILRVGKEKQIDSIPLDSRFSYLRVTLQNGRSFVLILGYEDDDPSNGAPVQTWYTVDGGKTTLRLQNGRFIGGSGWPVEVPSWTHVQLSAQPRWSDLASPATFTRRRDVMPGYAYGLTDTLTVHPIAAPKRTQLHGEPALGWQWFEETSSDTTLPPSHYAVETANGVAAVATVVYGEQCLTHTFCISWQRWPLYPQTNPSSAKP